MDVTRCPNDFLNKKIAVVSILMDVSRLYHLVFLVTYSNNIVIGDDTFRVSIIHFILFYFTFFWRAKLNRNGCPVRQNALA